MLTDNEFIKELDFKFDTEYLLNLIEKAKSNHNFKSHQRSVSDDQYLLSIKTKYPFLSDRWNYYDLVPYKELSPHIDIMRKAALNIPLLGTEGSITSFYDINNVKTRTYDDSKILDWVDTDLKPVFEFELLKPTVINNSLPHSVKNGPNRRVIISWSLKEEYTLDSVRDLFNT